jgi:hypothetical protein
MDKAAAIAQLQAAGTPMTSPMASNYSNIRTAAIAIAVLMYRLAPKNAFGQRHSGTCILDKLHHKVEVLAVKLARELQVHTGIALMRPAQHRLHRQQRRSVIGYVVGQGMCDCLIGE